MIIDIIIMIIIIIIKRKREREKQIASSHGKYKKTRTQLLYRKEENVIKFYILST
jgi:hypothetical protein